MLMYKRQTLAESMGLPKSVKVRRFFGFWFITPTHFHAVVAQQCYNLTHEFVTNKLHDSFYAGEGTPNYASLMELDRAMKEFTKSLTQED